MTRKKKWFIAIGVVVVLGGLAYANLGLNRPSGTQVTVEKVENRDLESIVSASGKIQPKGSVNISAETMGKVVALEVREGDFVKQGQFLLQIDARNLETQVQNREASLASARLQLDQTRGQIKNAEVALKEAEDTLKRQEQMFKNGLLPVLLPAETTAALRKGLSPDASVRNPVDMLGHSLGTFVMHPGICPEYRNAHGCFWALANRDLARVGMTLLRADADKAEPRRGEDGESDVHRHFHDQRRQRVKKIEVAVLRVVVDHDRLGELPGERAEDLGLEQVLPGAHVGAEDQLLARAAAIQPSCDVLREQQRAPRLRHGSATFTVAEEDVRVGALHSRA